MSRIAGVVVLLGGFSASVGDRRHFEDAVIVVLGRTLHFFDCARGAPWPSGVVSLTQSIAPANQPANM
jgi:hypothetical protein